jgi:hypothetical protein
MLSLALVLAGLILLSWRQKRYRALLLPAAVTAVTLLAVIGLLSWQTSSFRTRLTTENDADWYNAVYQAPQALQLHPGERVTLPFTVTNTGQATWLAQGTYSYALGYRWLDESSDQVEAFPFEEVDLPVDVAPGQSITLQVTVRAPAESGQYRLVWGMLQRHVLWFHHRRVPDALTAVTVTSTPSATTAVTPAPVTLPPAGRSVPVSRRELWRAAGQMIRERPLLGHGPDSFRHLYGRYLGLSEWDNRIHANNLYLELLATTGIVGTAVFAWLIFVIVRPSGSLMKVTENSPGAPLWQSPEAGDASPIILAGLSSTLSLFFLHGFLDYFLGFAPVAWLFWLVLGLMVRLSSKSW